jgi:2-oxo-3-hexenedioate decarboxylase/2-keto-4-pentenoate hydratase
MTAQTAEAAATIASHRLERHPLSSLEPRLRPRDIEAGYRLQASVNAILTQRGLGRVVGHKVGCTNPLLQARVGVPHPIAGAVFETTVHRRHAELSIADYVRPGVECEVVAFLDRDLPPSAAPYARAEVANAVGYLAAGMEIVDNRYGDLRGVDAQTYIADNALDAGAVIGEPVRDWRALHLPALVGTTELNGQPAGQGTGADVMGDPLNVVVWLVNDRARRGEGLRAGEFVFTGSIVDIVWVRPGDRVVTAISGLGRVEARFQ